MRKGRRGREGGREEEAQCLSTVSTPARKSGGAHLMGGGGGGGGRERGRALY